MVPRREPPPRPSSRRSFSVKIPSSACCSSSLLFHGCTGVLNPFLLSAAVRNSCTPYRGLKTCVSKHNRVWVCNRCRSALMLVFTSIIFFSRQTLITIFVKMHMRNIAILFRVKISILYIFSFIFCLSE